MTLPTVCDTTFQVLLASAKMGSRLNLASAQFGLSGDQLEGLLVESQGTSMGRVIVRGEDFPPILLAHLMLHYGSHLDIIWPTPTTL
ncbi:hypothetical protein Y046_4772 [Burkholderia pseudomallei MSHR2990]|uniref:hypothetical protein n=1 Tax=Burkholderia pseudomallei TaxID=28450 RepID=UPI0005378FCB|nr:hypothetical protein [Burkholderia pseudomallei]KGW78443.1 hypothetical protein Y046_4772 [Burkholderia pseudomallei MSHR2990]